MEAVVCVERRHFCRFLGNIVVSKFSEGKQVKPVVLIMVAKYTKICFKRLIHAFRLTVSLRVECRRFSRINLQDRSKGRPKMRSEYGSTIRYNRIRETMEFNNIRYEELGEVRRRRRFNAGNEVRHLGHSINEHKDRIHAV